MRELLTGMLMLLLTGGTFGQTILLECGQNSGTNFNGWFVENHNPFDAIEFDAHSVAFEHWLGGNLPVILTRKVESLKNYDLINLLFNFEVIRDCKINDVTYYTSSNGKKWNAINTSRNNVAFTVENPDHEIEYVRVVVNTQFEEDGKIALNYAKIEGEMNTTELPLIEVDEPIDEFFIFNFEKTLNIETTSQEVYELMITSISGNVIYRNAYSGSNRIELPSDIIEGIYIITIIQDNSFKASKKVIF